MDKKVSNLERVRVSRGMTQDQLAEKSGIPIRTIQVYECLARNINGTNVERLLDLCLALNCRLEDIIEGNGANEKARAVRNMDVQAVPGLEQYMPPYPQNLLQDVFEDKDAAWNCIDGENTLDHLYRSLPENWGDILKLRYRDNCTLEEIGNRYQVTRTRSGQIIHAALEKLKTPENITCLQMGIDAYEDYCEKAVHSERVKKASRQLSEISIEKLNLSARVHNALMRAGYDTIDKVADLNFEKIVAIKGMRETAANEVLTKIKVYIENRNPPVAEFRKIYEHDMDLLIMEEFVADRGFAQLFLDKIHFGDEYVIHKASHSLADADGESDITLVLQYPQKRIALLIEDKIDAQTMPEQSQRYHIRAQHAISRGEYDEYYVILAAPADYHKEHETDRNAAYEYRICYEELREYLCKQGSARAMFKTAIIDCALKEKKAGYQVQESPAVTEFWMKLRQFCKEQYPQLHMVGEDAPKGSAARWPEFRTSLGTIKVIYKSQKGVVDLEFPRYGDRIADLHSIIGDRMMEPMQIEKTGRSASVRLFDENWILDFTQAFDVCRTIIADVLQAVSKLCQFASTVNYSELY